jgi:hypothetical protein
MPESIAIVLDFQNVHLRGHHLFGGGLEPYRCVPDPTRLANVIAMRRRRPSAAAVIGVYRGRPDPEFQPTLTAANDAQANWWMRDRRVQVIRRQLNYRGWPGVPPQEKGIDVKLAVDLIHSAFTRRYDALVVFSSDTDLVPALEMIDHHQLGHVEVACWTGGNALRFAGSHLPWCHFLDQADWAAVTDDWHGRV